MSKSALRKSVSRSSLLLGAAVLAMPAAVAAQDQPVETVVVTGSRIPQTGLYSSSPVTAVGQQELKFEGTTNVENLLNNLPESFADQGQSVSNAASGTASVNLRNLGPKRTLVLIDGKRLMPGDPDAFSHATAGVADLDFIPAALVDHIEVLTGGASATYGSDALAGVVNFIMRKDFEGVEFDGQYTVDQTANDNFDHFLSAHNLPIPGHGIWDGQTEQGSVLIGANSQNGKGNVTLYASYQNTAPILQKDRDYSVCGAASNYDSNLGYFAGGFNCAGSTTIPQGKFIAVDRNNAGFPGVSGFVPNPDRTFSPFAGQTFDFAPYNYIQRPDTRYTFGAFGHYEVNPALDFYSSVMFMDDHTVAQIAPGGAFQTPFLINCDNPMLSAQQLATICPGTAAAPVFAINGSGNLIPGSAAQATVLIGRRAVESGTRVDDLRHTDYRIVLGTKGDLGGGWSYDLYAQYGAAIYADYQSGYWSTSHVQNALLVKSVNGTPTCVSVIQQTDPTCVPLDLFAPPTLSGPPPQKVDSSPLTRQMLNYIGAVGVAIGQTQEQVVSGSLTGDLGAWGIQSPWAKNPVSLAIGAEYRQEGLTYQPDLELRSGDLSGIGGPRPPGKGSYNVAEGFGEVRVPLVQNMPGLEDLSFNGGYRYSSYSSAGSTNTYKLGLEWQPVDDFRIRASYQRAVRAPNVTELFTPTAVILFGGQDPCANNAKTNAPPSTSVNQFCQNTGLTNFGTGGPGDLRGKILPCPASQCNQQVAGNPNLLPETSDTKSLGIVLTPTFLDGFTATIDYFNIRVNGVIGTLGASFLLGTCAAASSVPGGNSPACGFVHRDPTTGFIWTGNGYVKNPESNLGYLKTSGLDFEANYQKQFEDWGLPGYGGLSLNFIGTLTQSFVSETVPPSNPFFSPPATYDCVGHYGPTCSFTSSAPVIPEWRHKLRLTWNTPWDFDISLAWRHISEVTLDANGNCTSAAQFNAGGCVNPHLNVIGVYDANDARIPAFDYFDLAVNWTVREGVQLRAGVSNIFDKDPPFLDTNNIGVSSPPFGNGNTYPQVYDALGRTIFLGGTVKF